LPNATCGGRKKCPAGERDDSVFAFQHGSDPRGRNVRRTIITQKLSKSHGQKIKLRRSVKKEKIPTSRLQSIEKWPTKNTR